VRRRFVVVACSLLVALTAQPAAAAGGPTRSPLRPGSRPVARGTIRPVYDALFRAVASGRIDQATYVLERARSLFDVAGVRRRYGDVVAPPPQDATLDLRDLTAVYDRLTPAQRRIADGLLARPTEGANDSFGNGYTVAEATPVCGTNACFHWVTSTLDAPELTDADANNGVPDWVETVESTFDTVWSAEIATDGFRAPKSDLTSTSHGPDGRLDVYLADIGDQGYYGYCASDDPADVGGTYTYFDASAFCVIDNDFSAAQFPPPGASGVEALQVTLAHEFFHAVQFAYDLFEDRWWMEATATWIEDAVFPEVDDNLQYLPASPMARPNVPLDANNTSYGVYGDWIFFRFISELFASNGVQDVAVIRHAWELADGAPGGSDDYSIKAVSVATKAAGVPFREVFARFGMDDDVARSWYREGLTNEYPLPPLADKVALSKRHDAFADAYRMKHLTNAYVEFLPRRGVTSTSKLVLAVDLPPYRTGSEASAVSISTTGAIRFRRFRLDTDGDGRVRLRFGRGSIAAVDLVLTNASVRTRCGVDPNDAYSCFGDPTDDRLAYAFAASLRQ
jgi:hypothetical protein